MDTSTAAFARSYISSLQELLSQADVDAIDRIVGILLGAWKAGKRVLLMGNGGSSSTASHIVNDLQKNIHLEAGRPLRALCLSDCSPLMMAWANDTEWGNIFAPQVECWAEPGDVVIGISGSGNSMNVVNGIVAANRLGAVTIGLAGFDGGRLKETAQYCIVAPSDNMQRIEDVHMALLHVIFCALLRSAVAVRSEPAATA